MTGSRVIILTVWMTNLTRKEIAASSARIQARGSCLAEAGQPDLAESDLRRNYGKMNIRQKELCFISAASTAWQI